MNAYSRFGSDSDVFIFDDGQGAVCFSCPFDDADVDPKSRTLHNPAEVLAHLEEHVVAGHKVPPASINRVKSEVNG